MMRSLPAPSSLRNRGGRITRRESNTIGLPDLARSGKAELTRIGPPGRRSGVAGGWWLVVRNKDHCWNRAIPSSDWPPATSHQPLPIGVLAVPSPPTSGLADGRGPADAATGLGLAFGLEPGLGGGVGRRDSSSTATSRAFGVGWAIRATSADFEGAGDRAGIEAEQDRQGHAGRQRRRRRPGDRPGGPRPRTDPGSTSRRRS